MKKVIACWFLFLFTLLWMFTSCGTRKHEKNRDTSTVDLEQKTTTKEASTVADTSNVEVKIEKHSNEVTVTEKRIYTPIDPTKTSSFTDSAGNKKELKNSSYTEEKTTTNKQDSSKTEASKATGKKVVSNKAKTDNLNLKKKDDHLAINTERTSPSWWNLLWLLIPIGLYLLWKNKSKICGLWTTLKKRIK